MNEVMENQKLRQLVATARRLFMQHGIRRVSVEEVCREAGVSKVTFYKYFSNKVELAKALLQQIYDDQMAEYNEIIKRDIPFAEKAKYMVRMKQKGTELMGREFFQDIWKHPVPEVFEMLRQMQEDSMGVFLSDLRKAQENGDIRKDVKIELIVFMLNHLVDFAKDEELLELYHTPSELVIEIINFLFYGILTERSRKEV